MNDYRKDFKSVQSDYYWSMPRVLGMALVGVFGLSVIGWLIQGSSFFLFKVFAPAYEQVRRETFEQSKAYNEGMAQQVRDKLFAYETASPEHKMALRSLILHELADYDTSKFPQDLQARIADIRRPQ